MVQWPTDLICLLNLVETCTIFLRYHQLFFHFSVLDRFFVAVTAIKRMELLLSRISKRCLTSNYPLFLSPLRVPFLHDLLP